jgi:hypothetical protein
MESIGEKNFFMSDSERRNRRAYHESAHSA